MNRNERLIMRTLLAAAMAKGWQLRSLDDGERGAAHPSVDQAIELANNLDSCTWHLFLPAEKNPDNLPVRGWVHTIFDNGNDGLHVIANHTINLNLMQEGARIWAPGFMEQVDEFVDELEAYYQGSLAYEPTRSAKYSARDRLEVAGPALAKQLATIVTMYGKRGGELDALLPADQQEPEIATAIRLLADVVGWPAQ